MIGQDPVARGLGEGVVELHVEIDELLLLVGSQRPVRSGPRDVLHLFVDGFGLVQAWPLLAGQLAGDEFFQDCSAIPDGPELAGVDVPDSRPRLRLDLDEAFLFEFR